MAYLYSLDEYFRPWKLFSLACGVALLILGSIYTPAPDWDVGISLIMAGFTYLTAPCSIRVLLERNWRHAPQAVLATWFTIDGCYAIYWHIVDPIALDHMRSANFSASFGLYGICGVIWLYRGTLRQLLAEARKATKRARGSGAT